MGENCMEMGHLIQRQHVWMRKPLSQEAAGAWRNVLGKCGFTRPIEILIFKALFIGHYQKQDAELDKPFGPKKSECFCIPMYAWG